MKYTIGCLPYGGLLSNVIYAFYIVVRCGNFRRMSFLKSEDRDIELMKYEIYEKDSYMVIALSGDVDLYYSPQAREQILRQVNDKRSVLIDLSAVDYMDSSGVASLVEAFQIANKNQLEFSLISVSETVMQVLQLSRLDHVFPIHNSVSEYIEHKKTNS